MDTEGGIMTDTQMKILWKAANGKPKEFAALIAAAEREACAAFIEECGHPILAAALRGGAK